MIVTTPLDSNFTSELEHASEVWFALALVNEDGYGFLQAFLPINCIQHYLVGINLPTSPVVLRNLQGQRDIQSRVFKSKQTFHPKVYIVKRRDGQLVAFVGSSNATSGGFSSNIEVNFKIEDQNHCEELIDWFEKLFAQSRVIDESWLNRYEAIYLRRKRRSIEDKNDLSKVFDEKLPERKADIEKLDFDGLFFDKEDFLVFAEDKWVDYSNETVKKREIVREKLRVLHSIIYPSFLDYDITDLHAHNNPYFITSLIEYRPGQNKKEREAIWLHYGKSKEELVKYDNKKFINHCRIQVIIRETLLGIWFVIGKDKGSREDRQHFQEKLKSDDYQELIFNLVKELGTGYEIEISAIDSIKSEDVKVKKLLIDFLKKDEYRDYFIIKRDYPPNDNRLSKNSIKDTILNEFTKLYQLYDVIRDKQL